LVMPSLASGRTIEIATLSLTSFCFVENQH